jgi:hypothetical protein
MSQLTLSLVLNNHQPVGELDHVFADATDRAYDPVLQALARFAIHPTGAWIPERVWERSIQCAF